MNRILSISFRTAAAIVLGCGAFVSSPAHAQPQQGGGNGGVVTGSGQVTLTRQPNLLRMTMEVTGEGKDVKEALAKLKSEREAIAAKLKALGASEGAAKFDEPRVGGAGANANANARRAAMMRMRGNAAATRGAGKGEAQQPKVQVSAKVTAEWPLETGQSPEDGLAASFTLREKIKAGGLWKKADKANLTPEQQEELEEQQAMVAEDYGGNAPPMPGEPAFVFVCKIPAADRDAATAEAFKKAKADAARMAAATGAQLGEMRQVSGQATSSVAAEGDGNDYNYYQAQMMRQMGFSVPGSNAEEAAGLEPGPVSLQVTVTAAFAIK